MAHRSARRPVAALTLGYLLAGSAIVRGFLDYYGAAPAHLIAIATLYVVGIVIGATTRRRWWFGGHLLGVFQVGLMVWAFLVAPLSDTWALLLLPTCIVVNQDYDRKVGWMWIAIMTVVTGSMLAYGHGWTWAPQFIATYLAAYVLVGGYSIALKRAEIANQRNAELVRELRSAHAQLREYAEGVADLTAMKERNRIARDLHDSVTQTIFSMTLIAQASLILYEQGSPEFAEKLEQIENLSQSALKERIRSAVEAAIGDGAPAVDIRFPQELPAVGSALGQEISSIVQEALNNVVKHAQATRVELSAWVDRGHLYLRVEDDGVGFVVSSSSEAGHIGLQSMSERAKELNAQLSVTSSPGEGAAVELIVRLPQAGRYCIGGECQDG